jgi:hypothetical protein
VRGCVVLIQQPVIFSPNFWVKSSHIFMQKPWSITVICRIDSGLPGWILYEQSPYVKENDEHALDFALHLSRLFWSQWFRLFHSNIHVWLMLSTPSDCLIIPRVTVALFPRFAQHLMHTCCWIHQKITSGQIQDSK